MERRITVPELGLSVVQDHPEVRLLIIAHVFKVVLNKSEVEESSELDLESIDFVDSILAKAT